MAFSSFQIADRKSFNNSDIYDGKYQNVRSYGLQSESCEAIKIAKLIK